MSPPQAPAVLEQLSEHLLRLGRLARAVPAQDFLGQAVAVVRELVDFPRGWWGMGTDNGRDQVPSIHQSETIGLPDDFAAEWRKIAGVDTFSDDIRNRLGQVQHYSDTDDTALPVAIREFDRRYDIHYTLGLALDDTATGHGFFIVVYRSVDEPDFSTDEVLLFQHLVRHIVQLWHYSLQDALAAASQADIACAGLARPDGHVLYAGSQLCAMLYAEWPQWDGVCLPAALIARFANLPCKLRLGDGAVELTLRDNHVWLVRTRPDGETIALSPRENRVAQLYAQGLSYKEIARQLGLTPATVRTYLRDAYLRLGVKNKIQLGSALTGTSAR